MLIIDCLVKHINCFTTTNITIKVMLMQDNNPTPDPAQTQPQSSGVNESANNQALHHKLKHHLLSDKKVLTVVLVVVVAVAVTTFFVGKSLNHKKVANNITSKSSTSKAVTATPPTTQKLPQPDFASGNDYLASPKKMADLGFLTNYDKTLGAAPDYYQIGSTSAKQPILDMVFLGGPGNASNSFFIETSSGKYSLLAQNGGSDYLTDWQPYFAPNVSVDYKTKLNDISMPNTLSIAAQKMKGYSQTDQLSMNQMSLMANGFASIRGGFYGDVDTSAATKLGSQDGIDYYEVVAKDTDTYKVVEYHGAYKYLFSADYQPDGEIARNQGKLPINWTQGDNNSNSYFSAGGGCGSYGYVVAKNVNSGDLVKVGTTQGGQPVYQLPSSNSLVQEVFNKDYAGGQYADPPLKNLSIDQFTTKHGYFLVKNGLNEYVLYMRDDLIIQGGCAKPVIYLYPTAPTSVSVKVGARVVHSDPDYGKGWYSVMAYPDGSIKTNGKVYSSLFWDGYGNGAYPDITSGTIVETSQVAAVVKQQLVEQGLNSAEISDFLNYWQPKFSAITQPYTRLTWLNTAQMNSLAPLQITPAPQTLKRVFLDFEGLNKPYNLTAQTLTLFNRNGFTVVEWGGLARSGLEH